MQLGRHHKRSSKQNPDLLQRFIFVGMYSIQFSLNPPLIMGQAVGVESVDRCFFLNKDAKDRPWASGGKQQLDYSWSLAQATVPMSPLDYLLLNELL